MVTTKTRPTAQFYGHLMQTVSEGVLVLNEQGIITSANQAAARILGFDADGLVGRSWADLWGEEAPPLQAVGVNEQKDISLRQQNGRSVSINLSVTPISDHVTSSTLVSFTDLNDIDQLNEALSHTQRLAGIGILTASVAHELNTPLSIIAATCSNLMHEVEENNLSMEQLMKYVEMIEQSAWRSARIVEVLRNYSFDEEAQAAVTDLNMIIEDALTLVQHQFYGEFNIQIEKKLDENLKTILCDHNRITQVLINLLTNARDAMLPQGGRIEIRSWAIPSESLLNGNTAPPNGRDSLDEQYAFSVKDTGSGIAPEVMDRLFDPFFTTKPHGKGTGLGLFIAQRIVQQHNGRIWAENNPEGGATFTVALPRRQ